MSTFSKISRPVGNTNTPGGVWQIEKKRKARDKKNKKQKYLNKEQKNSQEESVLVDIKTESESINKECEDQMGYGLVKKSKSLCNHIDLKI